MWGEMEIGGDGVMLFGSENGKKKLSSFDCGNHMVRGGDDVKYF